jgi:hypothetical protein
LSLSSAFCTESCLERNRRIKISPDRPSAKSGLISQLLLQLDYL